jgi:ferredoxin-NADP reductase
VKDLNLSPDAVTLAVEVVDKRRLADDVVMLRLARRGRGALPGWAPGAHIDVSLPSGLVRQYSLCNEVVGETSFWEIAVLREGPGSQYIHDVVSTGDVLEAGGPRNNFELVGTERYLFLAGGIGITPFRPMLAVLSQRGADWSLVYGGRTRRSMAFLEEFTARYGTRVDCWPLDERGLIDLDVVAGHAPGRVVYCCGPDSLLNAVQQRCAGWPSGSLRVERFRAEPLSAPVRRQGFEVSLARSNLVVHVPPDQSILASLREAGLEIASSCEEGVCGTCETRVLEGEVDHRDSILTPDEQSANDTMMICCSRAISDRLVLDL